MTEMLPFLETTSPGPTDGEVTAVSPENAGDIEEKVQTIKRKIDRAVADSIKGGYNRLVIKLDGENVSVVLFARLMARRLKIPPGIRDTDLVPYALDKFEKFLAAHNQRLSLGEASVGGVEYSTAEGDKRGASKTWDKNIGDFID